MIALQRTDEFVGRTTNWLYDHLRFLPRYTRASCATASRTGKSSQISEARAIESRSLSHRVWRRACGERVHPLDRIWLKRKAPRVLHSHFGYVAAGDMALAKTLQIPMARELLRHRRLSARLSGAVARELRRHVRERGEGAGLVGRRWPPRLRSWAACRTSSAVHFLGIDAAGLPFEPRKLGVGEPLRLLFAGTFREKKGIEYVVQGRLSRSEPASRWSCTSSGSHGQTGRSGDRARRFTPDPRPRDPGPRDAGRLPFVRAARGSSLCGPTCSSHPA